jgi:hypothetical protein
MIHKCFTTNVLKVTFAIEEDLRRIYLFLVKMIIGFGVDRVAFN